MNVVWFILGSYVIGLLNGYWIAKKGEWYHEDE